MRLHSLRMRAFGPFATEQVVDFDRLGAGGLFLLDGPTGAGKTTVLDAVIFALYGPGDRGGDGRLHSGFADPGCAPQVVLEFSVRGTRHRITRVPEHERPKRRGSGTTKAPAAAHLERLEAGRWVSRSANKAEVGDMLAAEIGLTRAQFTQVVLLPQGEFAKFLRAGDDERRSLLTTLFAAHLYDRITDELDRRRQAVTRDLDADRQQVQAWAAAVAEAGRLDSGERAALLAAADLDGVVARVGSRLASADRSARQAARRAAAGLATARTRQEAAIRTLDAALAAQAARAALAAHEATRPEHAARVAALEAARSAEPVRPLLAAASEAQERCTAAVAAVPGLTEAETPAALVAVAAAATEEAAGLQHLVEREREARSRANEVAVAAGELAEASAEVETLTARLATLPAKLESASSERAAASDAAARLPELCDRLAGAQRRLAAAQRLLELAPQLAAAREALDAATEAYHGATEEQLRLQEARLAGIAAELAAGLLPGEACPVCGAAEHPRPALAAAGAVSGRDVVAATQRRAAAEGERDLLRAAHDALRREQATAAERADGADAAALALDVDALRDELAAAERLAAQLERPTARLRALEAELAACSAARTEAAARHAAAQERRDALAAETTRVADELSTAAGADESVAARQQRLRADAARLTARAEAVAVVLAAREQRDAAHARAAAEAAARGFDSVASAAAAARDPDELCELEAAVAEWEHEAARRQAALPPDSGEDASDPEPLRAAAAEADVELAARAAAAEEATREAELAADALARYAAAAEQLASAQRTLREREQQAEPVVHLARLAKGVAGDRRVALTTFVLRYWFEQVVAAANVRLTAMSSGRYELVRVDEGTRASERAGLTLEVLDRHTGAQRSARSLSGGETFYTSLALALGLADVVRAEAGGVDLDTLFIDEGFGSLDADTLEEVLAVIDDLRGRGRVVGIVSHVADLKDRIPERLEVRRRADGSSEVRVVA